MCRRRFPTARQSNGALRSRSQALHPGPAGGPPPIYGSIAEPELLLAHELEEPARLSLGGLSSRSQRTHRRRPPRMLRDAGTGCWRDAYRANRSAWPGSLCDGLVLIRRCRGEQRRAKAAVSVKAGCIALHEKPVPEGLAAITNWRRSALSKSGAAVVMARGRSTRSHLELGCENLGAYGTAS
jgi:hypothetical protein